ncbi:MAG: pilin [Candidatus Pacebacteria bacterium]|nr:pilin [Candidatus Paceibacterota bacterium]
MQQNAKILNKQNKKIINKIMNKKISKYLTKSYFSLLVTGMTIIPSIIKAADEEGGDAFSGISVSPWSGEMKISEVLYSVANILFTWAAPLCILMIIVGGLFYMTAGDDSGKTKKGFDFIKYALIGLVFILAAAMLLNFVAGLAG